MSCNPGWKLISVSLPFSILCILTLLSLWLKYILRYLVYPPSYIFRIKRRGFPSVIPK